MGKGDFKIAFYDFLIGKCEFCKRHFQWMNSPRLCRLYKLLAPADYEQIWRYQKALMKHCTCDKKLGKPTTDSLIIVQHPSIYTLGKAGTASNIIGSSMQDGTVRAVRVERGGEIAFHGPGQLIAYPIFDLDQLPHKRDLHWLSRSLEETVIRTIAQDDVKGERTSINTGVWIGGNKVSAQGISASRWVTMHGVSVNLTTDLSYYNAIIPCGIDSKLGGVCNLQSHVSKPIDINEFSERWIKSFAEVFNLQMEEINKPQDELLSLLDADLRHQQLEVVQLV